MKRVATTASTSEPVADAIRVRVRRRPQNRVLDWVLKSRVRSSTTPPPNPTWREGEPCFQR
jgi:hypothetical protein